MLPSGTTSRQLTSTARWALAGVVGITSLTAWWPSAFAWGAMGGGVVIVLILWLMAKTTRGDRSAPAGLFHLALLGPAVLLAGHFLWHSGIRGQTTQLPQLSSLSPNSGDHGALDISAIYQFALIALCAMLAQDLFASPRVRGVPALLAGAGMIVGALAAAFWGGGATLSGDATLSLGDGVVSPLLPGNRPASTVLPMGLLAFSGAGLWVSILCSRPYRPPRAPRAHSTGATSAPEARPAAASRGTPHHVMHAAALAATTVLCAALVLLFPREGLLAACLLGAAALLGAIILGGKWLRNVGVVLLVLVANAMYLAVTAGWLGRAAQDFLRGPGPEAAKNPLGIGEDAYRTLTASTSGLEFLGAEVGWAGLAWLGTGLLAAVVLSLWRARGTGEGAAAVFRVWSAGLAMAAFLWPMGPFVPSVSLGVAFAWGFLQAPGARPAKARRGSGWALLLFLAAVMLLLALAPEVGLLEWSTEASGLHDDFLHIVVGMLFTSIMAWQFGGGRLGRSLVAIAIAMAAGGAGELAQYFFTSSRNAEWSDFLFHCVGCAAGALPYLLSLGARLAEEPAE